MVVDTGNISSVVRKSLCLQCGTCVSVCPENCIVLRRDKMQNYVPVVNEQHCVRCGLCLKVCPGAEVDFESLSGNSGLGEKGRYHQYIGKYLNTFLGYSTEKEIRAKASSGGVVSAILLYLLETEVIDGAIVVRNREKSPFNPEVFVARSRDEIFDSMQSKYHPVCLNTALKEIETGGKYALVGLPCHIQGLRKLEKLKKLDGEIFLTIGLFCGLNLQFDSLEFFAYKVGENVADLEKVVYREGKWPGKMVLQFSGNKRRAIDKNIVNHIFTLPRCLFCIDHTSELADVSCGDAWLPEVVGKGDDGWSAVISRSFRGQEILNELIRENRLFLEKVDVNKIIESQCPMLCFKKKNSWLRLNLSRILGENTPKYTTESLDRNLSLPYLTGNALLIFVIYLMKSNMAKNLVKNIPLIILNLYEVLILRLLYTDRFLYRIGRKVVNNFSEISGRIGVARTLNLYEKYKEKHGLGAVVLFPGVLLWKIIRKKFLYARNVFEYDIYAFVESKDYGIDYLKKITGLGNEKELWKELKDKKKLLINWTGPFPVERYNKLFPGKMESKINRAKLVCEHTFDLLGSGPRKLSLNGDNYQAIDWHSDFKSGYRWDPKLFFRLIKDDNVRGVDIIVPWEQSRFQDRMALAQAYKLTGNPKFAVEFQEQINDWIENNRFGFGVNWFCTMDIAVRVVNWLAIKELFETGFDFPEAFLIKLYGSLYDHGRYIRKHLLSFKNITMNHYISGIVGLLFISAYCPFFKKSREWRDFAVRELEKEIEKQVYPDGCDYEASTSYHLLVLEMFFYALLLCEKAEISLSDLYKDKVRKMFECTLYYLKSNGMAPQVGDNDNGRLFKFSEKPILEHEYLLSLAAVYFKDGKFRLKQSGLAEEAFWIFGEHAQNVWHNLPLRGDWPRTKSFPDAGWHTIRHNNDYCFISCGPNGQGGRGGHAHNDKLSFELVIDGQDIIVDPGTYVYTPCPEERNKFRSTGYHNTISFDGYEQNEFPEENMFYVPDRVKIKKTFLEEAKKDIRFEGEIQYLDFTHRRVISLDKGTCSWRITDSISSPKPVTAKLVFHLSPDVFYDDGAILLKNTNKKIVSIEAEGYDFKKGEYDYSPEYGIKIKAEYLAANIFVNKETRLINTLINN